ncbi:AP2 domain transcription factor AP2IX-9 [Cardiosporidium cionae]|uniref:AP2 domain transcription factor AP2IX-9 n=1 Tax=Cardiosporidium cionae TaxID=476202 RepID=A0ABQ7J5S2_9APIC|nr:AP2 domain transcription factor AP2IX-9 [Cardiosporidium cionae]|eukprot:KAF8819284.1 AP2 domain transcription factor AP2IX-9 [Cardiosporidium cionae]
MLLPDKDVAGNVDLLQSNFNNFQHTDRTINCPERPFKQLYECIPHRFLSEDPKSLWNDEGELSPLITLQNFSDTLTEFAMFDNFAVTKACATKRTVENRYSAFYPTRCTFSAPYASQTVVFDETSNSCIDDYKNVSYFHDSSPFSLHGLDWLGCPALVPSNFLDVSSLFMDNCLRVGNITADSASVSNAHILSGNAVGIENVKHLKFHETVAAQNSSWDEEFGWKWEGSNCTCSFLPVVCPRSVSTSTTVQSEFTPKCIAASELTNNFEFLRYLSNNIDALDHIIPADSSMNCAGTPIKSDACSSPGYSSDSTRASTSKNISSKSISKSENPRRRSGVCKIELDNTGLVATFVTRKGVYFDKTRKLWRANWKENGRIHTKGFSVNEYGNHAAARHRAIEFREGKEQALEFYKRQKYVQEIKTKGQHAKQEYDPIEIYRNQPASENNESPTLYSFSHWGS